MPGLIIKGMNGHIWKKDGKELRQATKARPKFNNALKGVLVEEVIKSVKGAWMLLTF